MAQSWWPSFRAMRHSYWEAIRRAKAVLAAEPPEMPRFPEEYANPPHRGAHKLDPITVMALPAKLVAGLACPQRLGYHKPLCGAQALLYRFPDPYGFRSYCDDDHVCILSPLAIEGLFHDPKLRTD